MRSLKLASVLSAAAVAAFVFDFGASDADAREGGVYSNAAGRRVALLRAYDKLTGADVGAVEMPNKQTGSPISYQIDGKQFIVLAVSGNDGAELLAYALP